MLATVSLGVSAVAHAQPPGPIRARNLTARHASPVTDIEAVRAQNYVAPPQQATADAAKRTALAQEHYYSTWGYSIRSGAVVGSLAPFGCMRGLRLAGGSSGPVSVWIRRPMPGGAMWESRCSAGCGMPEPAVAERPLGRHEARRVL
jgi:hypothetical protein